MKKVLVFGASTSRQSINKQLVRIAANMLENVDVEIIDLNDFDVPLYSQDRENEQGVPQAAQNFLAKVQTADGLLISFAEHNGSYAAAYKNLFDWASRIQPKVYAHKPMVLLSTSPGARGGASVLEAAKTSMPHFGAQVKASMAVPSFYDQVDTESNSLKSSELENALRDAVMQLFA